MIDPYIETVILEAYAVKALAALGGDRGAGMDLLQRLGIPADYINNEGAASLFARVAGMAGYERG